MYGDPMGVIGGRLYELFKEVQRSDYFFPSGWEGFRCEACIPLPGCENGHCQNEAFECICDEPDLWTGDHCDERKA